MAEDWIKIRVDLIDDPAVISISEELDMDDFSVVGRLVKLWSWADKHSVNGNALCVTRMWIDRYINRTGFANAMANAGWLRGDDGEISLPNFERHNGNSAKKRAETNRRVANHRASKTVTQTKQDCNAKRVTKSVTREEKRRYISPIIPTLSEVIERCKEKGYNETFAKYYFETNTEREWKRNDGVAITKWRSNLATWISGLKPHEEAKYKLHPNGRLPRASEVTLPT